MRVLHVTSKSKSFLDFLKQSSLPVDKAHDKWDERARGNRKPWS